MRILYHTLNLAPAPLFLIFGLFSWISGPSVCGSFSYEMTVMWFVMFLAHLTPWILWFKQRYFTWN